MQVLPRWIPIIAITCLQIILDEAYAMDDEQFSHGLCQSPDENIHAFHLTGGVLDRVLDVWSEVIAFDEEVGWVKSYDELSDDFLRDLIGESLPANLSPFLRAGMSAHVLKRSDAIDCIECDPSARHRRMSAQCHFDSREGASEGSRQLARQGVAFPTGQPPNFAVQSIRAGQRIRPAGNIPRGHGLHQSCDFLRAYRSQSASSIAFARRLADTTYLSKAPQDH